MATRYNAHLPYNSHIPYNGVTSSAPNAPSALTAAPVSAISINLAWNDNGGSETGFYVERSPDGITFAQIAILGAGVVAYADMGLAPSTLYYYRVRAFNGSGNSGYSNVASATTPTTPVIIAPPGEYHGWKLSEEHRKKKKRKQLNTLALIAALSDW